MNRRPPPTAGCERDCVALGTPNAHLSLRFATFAAVIPAALACHRVLRTSRPQPFHPDVALRRSSGPPVHSPVGVLAAPAVAAVSGRPATRSATALRCAGDGA